MSIVCRSHNNREYPNNIFVCRECDIDFYYAISPGLDITYSNAKEIACLKRKLDQVGIVTSIYKLLFMSDIKLYALYIVGP